MFFYMQSEDCIFLFKEIFYKKRNEKYIKLIKIVAAVLMFFSLLYTVTVDAKAWDDIIPHEFRRVMEIKYREWWGHKVPELSARVFFY